MPQHGERDFRLPAYRRVPWWVWLIALVLHVPIVLLLLTGQRNRRAWEPPATIAISDTTRAMVIPRRSPRTARAGRPPAPVPAAALPEPVPIGTATRPAVVAVDTPPVRAPDLRPHYGDGRLWVAPLPESPRRMAKAISGKSDAELADSAVTAMVQAYLDQMASEQRGRTAPLPSWTTRIAGKTVGVDQRWIYLGPLKVPTALLALLPIKVQANPTEAEYNARLARMRDDLYEAARRTATYQEFKQAVKALREQTEQKRQFDKNQRTPPDSSRQP